MDLRECTSPDHLERAQELVCRGLLGYQPYIFSDDFETGVAHEFLGGGEWSGMVYWPGLDPALRERVDHLRRWVIPSSAHQEFSSANARLRRLYDHFVDSVVQAVGEISNFSFAEVGCNTGYFLQRLAERGAGSTVGFDRDDYSETIRLLNEIKGTDTQFICSAYDGRTQRVPGAGTYDVVLSIAVICHLSDILQHLACLGSMARRALFIWAPVTEADELSISFGQPNKYYTGDPFPYCFDNLVRPSRQLVRKSLELMGFKKQIEFGNVPGAMPDGFFNAHIAILGLRD